MDSELNLQQAMDALAAMTNPSIEDLQDLVNSNYGDSALN